MRGGILLQLRINSLPIARSPGDAPIKTISIPGREFLLSYVATLCVVSGVPFCDTVSHCVYRPPLAHPILGRSVWPKSTSLEQVLRAHRMCPRILTHQPRGPSTAFAKLLVRDGNQRAPTSAHTGREPGPCFKSFTISTQIVSIPFRQKASDGAASQRVLEA